MRVLCAVAIGLLMCSVEVPAVAAQAVQQPAQPPAAPGGRGGRGAVPQYPPHPQADAATIARGQQLFSVNCSFCHGSDAKGGEGGPNLIRSALVLDDKNGELIAPVVQNGRPDLGMPKFDLSLADITAIAGFIHSFPVGGRVSRGVLIDALVGDAAAGKAYFDGAGKCSTCHSPSGDLAGIGAKFDTRALQGVMLMGRPNGAAALARAVPTVTVTMPDGKLEGTLNAIDDFSVSLTTADGYERTIARNGNTPQVEVHDPLKFHKDLLHILTDTDIHNLTAYLVTLK